LLDSKKGESRTTMNRLKLLAMLGFVLLSTLAFGFGRDGDDDHEHMSATDMNIIGLVAASVVGGGSYLLVRRKAKKG